MVADRMVRAALLALSMAVGTAATAEEGASAAQLAQLAARIAALEAAVTSMQASIVDNAERVQAITDRLARGEDPLVALEIEALGSVIRSMSLELGELREGSGAAGSE